MVDQATGRPGNVSWKVKEQQPYSQLDIQPDAGTTTPFEKR